MKHYIKLVNFELNRFMKMYLALFAFLLLVQTIVTVVLANLHLGAMTQMSKMNESEMLEPFSLIDLTYTFWFSVPIGICVATLLLYTLFIWYRDWFSKNAFIYRLLTLPSQRMNVYFAKLTTILLTTIGMVVFQIVVLGFLSILLKWLVPAAYRVDVPLIEVILSSGMLQTIIPDNVLEFFLSYGVGLVFVIVVFTAILMERSFRWKGIALALTYVFGIMLLLVSPILVEAFWSGFSFYATEMFWIRAGLLTIVAAVSLWLSHYLLNKRIMV